MKTDIEIATSTKMASITSVAKKANIGNKYLEQYGKYKAKINLDIYVFLISLYLSYKSE